MKHMKRLASALLALLLLASLSAPAALAADKVYRETTSQSTIYAGAGTTYKVVTSIPKGDVVEVTNWMLKEWWKVKYTNSSSKTYEGYIRSSILKETSKRSNKKQNLRTLGCYKTTTSASLRSGAGSNYKLVTTVPSGNRVNVTDTKEERWSKCTFINKKGKKYTGYIAASSLKKAPEPYKVKSATQLRKKASSSSKNLSPLPKGSYLYVTGSSGKWFKVDYPDINGKTHAGYVLKSKVKKTTVTNKPIKQVDPYAEQKWMAEKWRTKTRYTLTAKTKLTKTAKKNGKKVATLSKGAVVAVAGSSGKYYRVVWNNSSNQKKQGYLPKNKLKKYKDSKAGEYVTTAKTQLRKTDATDGQVLVTLSKYTLFTVKDTSEKNWYWASYKKGDKTYTGFVYKSHAKKYVEKNAGNYCASAETFLRKSASETGEELQTIPLGSLVKVKKTYNPNWYYVSYTDPTGETAKGYVASAHLKRFQSQKLDYVAIAENSMRTQPSPSAESAGTYQKGDAVTVNDTLEVLQGWYWASFTDAGGTKHTGFVYSADLMTREEYEATQNEQQHPEQQQPDQPTDLSAQSEEAAASVEAADDESAEPQEEGAAEETSEALTDSAA